MNLRRKHQQVTKGKAPLRAINKLSKHNLEGKKVCISGTIPGATRHAAEFMLRSKYKVQIHTNVTSTTDYLITGPGVGQSKLKLAARWGVTLIDSTELF